MSDEQEVNPPEITKDEDEDEDFVPLFIPEWDTNEVNKINDVLNSENLVEAAKVGEFEDKFAAYVKAEYCVMFPNFSSAMYCAMIVAREIISTKNLRVPNFGGQEIYNIGIQSYFNPVLTEVNELGSLILRDNEGGITKHFNGRKGKASIIEDCSDILNYHTPNKISVYNFDSKSLLTTGGQGGAICCDDVQTYEALLRVKNMGKNPLNEEEYYGDDTLMWGLNYEVTEMQAAFGLAQLEKLDEKLERINVLDNILREAFIDHKRVKFLQGKPHKYLDILVPDAEKTQLDLAKKGIMTQRFPRPLHMQTYSSRSGRIDNDFTESEKLYETGLFITTIPSISDDDFRKIIDQIKSLEW